ncbi:MAG TPA: PQQ-binding-like beta-propeller repeat protein, partial [Gemmataceae bacterium]|nr:PQQ-binding-like beta-propeller repeat protein [Gemmataceae bacterium]
GPLTAWDVATGKRLRRWNPPAGPSEWVKDRESGMDVVPSPDGRLIAWFFWRAPNYSNLPPGVFPPPPVIRRTAVVVADAATEKPLYRRTFEVGALDSFPFTGDGQRFLTTGDKLRVWDAPTGKELLALDCPSAYRCALTPDGRRSLVADANSRVRLWDLEAKKPAHELCNGRAYINSHTLESPQTFSADGKTVLLVSDSTLRLFDTTTGKEKSAPGHRSSIIPRFSADGRTLFTTCDEARCRWDLSGKEPVLRAHEPRRAWEGICGDRAVAHSGDGTIFVDRRDDRTCLRDTATGRVVRELEGAPGAFFGLFSPDASRVLVWHSSLLREDVDGIRLYDVRTGKSSGEFQTANAAGRSVEFSPDGRFVAWTDHAHSIHLHDAATGNPVRTLSPRRPPTKAECNYADLLFSPDGSYLIVTTYFREPLSKPDEADNWETLPTRVLRVADGREVAHFYLNPARTRRAGRLSCAACSPDARLLALAEEESGPVRVIEIAGGGVRAELAGHRDGVRGLAFSPDGKTLASGGADNVVFLWDVTGARTAQPAKAAGEPDPAAWWADLAADDARRAGAAIASFLRAPGPGVAFLKERLRPAEIPSKERLDRLIAGLDADTFAAREAAGRELARLGERAEAALRRAVKAGPSPEVSRRIDDLLDRLADSPPANVLCELRAIEALEFLGTSEAVRCLEEMVRGAPEAWQTRDARAALARLAARR